VKNYRNKQQGEKKKNQEKKSLRKKRKKRRGIKTRSRKGGNPEIFVLFVICSFAFYWMDLVPGNNAHQTVEITRVIQRVIPKVILETTLKTLRIHPPTFPTFPT